MSSIESEIRSAAKKAGATNAQGQDLASEVEAIRADVERLGDTLKRVANRQVANAQGLATEKVYEAEEAIRQNPITAIAVAAGLGFFIGALARR